MALRDWLSYGQTATAKIATTAKKQPANPRNVATVAEIAVANGPKDGFVDQETPNLPTGCPLRGGSVPKSCRFDPRLFKRMVQEGAVVLGEPCPILRVCNLSRR